MGIHSMDAVYTSISNYVHNVSATENEMAFQSGYQACIYLHTTHILE